MSALGGREMGPIKEQRSGLGGGRVPIIGGIGASKLSSFVLNSSCPAWSARLSKDFQASAAEYRDNINLTSHWGSLLLLVLFIYN